MIPPHPPIRAIKKGRTPFLSTIGGLPFFSRVHSPIFAEDAYTPSVSIRTPSVANIQLAINHGTTPNPLA
jgi:hypothetical protein